MCEDAFYQRLYRSLYRIRRTEEEIARIYPTDKIKSPIHLSIGQEAVSVGVCEALRENDVAFGTYRSHAMFLAKGGDLKKMIAELYGKIDGCAKGKGGSMHLIDVARGVMGTSAVVGTSVANAVGYAYAVKYRREDRVVVSFFGDGATEEGVFHESLNFASLKKLPILFVCENNGYAIHTHQRHRQKTPQVWRRANGYGMPSEIIDDNDVFRVYQRASHMVNALREGTEGPCFLEVMTYRWKEHVGPNEDYHLGYRTEEEARPWMESDQVERLAAMLATEDRLRIQSEVRAEIADAFAWAEESPFPERDELFTDVFKGS